MALWEQYVDLLRAAIVAYSQACGGNLGVGIMAVTLLVRMAMLPLTLRVARFSAAHQETMRKLKPRLEEIRARYKKRPERLGEETRRLFEKEGVSPLPMAGCAGMLVQLPILIGLFSAVRRCVGVGGRFLWIRNIAKPDILLTVIVTGLTYLTVALGVSSGEQNKALLIAIPTVVAFLVVAKMPAGIGLYWGASSLVSLLQTAIIRRERMIAPRAVR